MAYIKVYWKHTFPDEPILMFSELDEKRNEIRKVEVYRHNLIGCAWGDISRNGTFLSKYEIPEINVINEDAQFEGIEIEREEFEEVWEKAINIK